MKNYVKVALFALALCLSIAGLDCVMRRGDGADKYSAFFEEKQEFDVLFCGTSHVMNAVMPMQLWRDYGITSYDIANPAETMEASYWTLRFALEEHTPKIVVIDVPYMARAQSEVSTRAMGHLFMDEIPLSLLKLQAIWELYPEGERAQYVLPLIVYHTRWEELFTGTEPMIETEPFMRGAELRCGRSEPAEYVRTLEMDERDMPGKRALLRMIELCQARGIEVVLTAIPFPTDEEWQKIINSAQIIADDTGVPFLNLFDAEGLVDFETDCYDEASHLNPDGAVKVTRYLGEYLVSHYALKNKRSDPAYAHWEKDLSSYEALYEEKWGPYQKE